MERCYGSIGTTGGLGLDTADEIYLSGTAWFIAVQPSPDPLDQVPWGGGSSALKQTDGTRLAVELAHSMVDLAGDHPADALTDRLPALRLANCGSGKSKRL